jgi:hypothetical protein
MPFGRRVAHLILKPGTFIFTQIRRRQFRASLCASQHVQAGVGGDACQPSLHRTAPFVTAKLGKRFHKNFLRRFFNHAALAKEFAGKAKNSRAVTSHYLSERSLVTGASKLRQFQIRTLVTVGQKRSFVNGRAAD